MYSYLHESNSVYSTTGKVAMQTSIGLNSVCECSTDHYQNSWDERRKYRGLSGNVEDEVTN